MSNFLGQLIGAGAGAALLKGAYDRLGGIGDNAFGYDENTGEFSGAASPIANQAVAMSEFQPFGITSSLGESTVDANGNINVGLSPEQQALQSSLGQGANSMFARSQNGVPGREQEVYNRIRAMQQPEEARARLAMENRMFNQGRTGVRTDAYGGTPEQLAMFKAQAEAENTAAVQAMQQAQSEQMQDANIGQMMLQGMFMPEAQAMNRLQAGTNIAGITDVARRQQAGLFGETMMSGLETKLGAGLGQANLMGELGSSLLAGILTPQYGAAGQLLNPLFGSLFNGDGSIWT